MSKASREATDVAEKVLDHLRTMYPDALKAVPASASISLRNFTASAVHLAILAAEQREREEIAAMIEVMAEDVISLSPVVTRSKRDMGRSLAQAIRNRGE